MKKSVSFIIALVLASCSAEDYGVVDYHYLVAGSWVECRYEEYYYAYGIFDTTNENIETGSGDLIGGSQFKFRR